ncbi:SDR family oxidoreductase [candidate division KSB1 bacterium]
MEFTFTLTEELVRKFSEITSDYNAIHTDAEAARRSYYRELNVYGFLPFSFVALLQLEFKSKICFKKFDILFRKALFLNDVVEASIHVNSDKDRIQRFKAEFINIKSSELLIECDGELIESDAAGDMNTDSGTYTSFVIAQIQENSFTIDNLSLDHEEQFDFVITEELREKYMDMLLSELKLSSENVNREHGTLKICSNLLSSLLISPMAGMRLPGKYNTCLNAQIGFRDNIQLGKVYTFRGKVKKVLKGIRKAKIEITIEDENKTLADGAVTSLVLSTPKITSSAKEIKEKFLDMNLEKKVAVITGASRGIGAATAKLLASLGARVIVNYFKGKSDAETVVRDIRQEGGEAAAVYADVRNEQDVEVLIKSAVETYGTVDILINNAVGDFISKEYLLLNWDDYLKELEVTLKGAHNCCRTVIPVMTRNKSGKIINISCLTTEHPIKGQAKYTTVKSTLTGFTRSLAVELIKFNIQVNLVVPNMTETDLLSGMPEKLLEKIVAEREFGRTIEPAEVAQAVAFLASGWSDTITGQRLVLNAGEISFL